MNDKAIAFSIKAVKVMDEILLKTLKAFLQQGKKHLNQRVEKGYRGKVPLKRLMARADGKVNNLEISANNIKSFERVARKFGVTYNLTKAPGKDHYYVFFKAASIDVMTAAFNEYTRRQTLQQERPSVLGRLASMQKLAQGLAKGKLRDKEREVEL